MFRYYRYYWLKINTSTIFSLLNTYSNFRSNTKYFSNFVFNIGLLFLYSICLTFQYIPLIGVAEISINLTFLFSLLNAVTFFKIQISNSLFICFLWLCNYIRKLQKTVIRKKTQEKTDWFQKNTNRNSIPTSKKTIKKREFLIFCLIKCYNNHIYHGKCITYDCMYFTTNMCNICRFVYYASCFRSKIKARWYNVSRLLSSCEHLAWFMHLFRHTEVKKK